MSGPVVGANVTFVQSYRGRKSYAFYTVTRVDHTLGRVYVRSIGGLMYCDAVHRDGWYAIDDERARY